MEPTMSEPLVNEEMLSFRKDVVLLGRPWLPEVGSIVTKCK